MPKLGQKKQEGPNNDWDPDWNPATGPVTVLGIDPGEHVGLAKAVEDWDAPGKWRVEWTREMTPSAFREWFLDDTISRLEQRPDIISCEDFQLYADKAKVLIGSKLETVRLLGWIQYTVEQLNRHMELNNWDSLRIEWISCPASVQRVHGSQEKSPTAGAMRALGIPYVSPPGANKAAGSTGEHQRSAELHLWAGLMKLGLVPGVK